MRLAFYALLSLIFAPFAIAFDGTIKPVSPDGTYAIIDLPTSRHVRNIGGSDSAGLCVYTSVQHGADWHNVSQLAAFQKWAAKRPGGSYPEKLDADITAFCASQGATVPAYVQHVGGDEAFLDLAIKTGRMVGVTYAGVDGFYSGPIAHMVNLAHLDASHAAIIDNNRPGQWVWMTRTQFLNRWRGVYDNGSLMTVREGAQTYQIGGGWAFAYLSPPPPPYTTKPVAVGDALPEVKNFGIIIQKPTAEQAPKETNFGIDSQRLRTQNRKFSLNGTEVSKAVAFSAILADDSDRYSLTFVGLAVPSQPGVPELVRSKTHIQAYKAGDWEVSQFGLKPGVTLRKPQTSRVGVEVYQGSALDVNAVIAAISGEPVKPKLPSKLFTVEVTGELGLTPFTLTITPRYATPPPPPAPVKTDEAPKPREVVAPPKSSGGRLLIDGKWHTERDGVYHQDAASQPYQPVALGGCANGRCPLR